MPPTLSGFVLRSTGRASGPVVVRSIRSRPGPTADSEKRNATSRAAPRALRLQFLAKAREPRRPRMIEATVSFFFLVGRRRIHHDLGMAHSDQRPRRKRKDEIHRKEHANPGELPDGRCVRINPCRELFPSPRGFKHPCFRSGAWR